MASTEKSLLVLQTLNFAQVHGMEEWVGPAGTLGPLCTPWRTPPPLPEPLPLLFSDVCLSSLSIRTGTLCPSLWCYQYTCRARARLW